MALTVTLDLSFNPEQVSEVLDQFKVLLHDTRAFKGCLSVDLLHDQDKPGRILLVERWEQKSDQEAYIAWRTETGEMGRTAEIVTAPIVVSYLEEVQRY